MKYQIFLPFSEDQEKLTAQIFIEGQCWAEIIPEYEALEIKFYPRPDGEPWQIDSSTAVKAIGEAELRLIGQLNDN